MVNFNAKVGSAVVGNNNVSIKQIKSVKQKYPEGCMGFETVKANYVAQLIKRFNDYKEYEVGKGHINYAQFFSRLKSEYKIGSTRTVYNIPINKFDELTTFNQELIALHS